MIKIIKKYRYRNTNHSKTAKKYYEKHFTNFFNFISSKNFTNFKKKKELTKSNLLNKLTNYNQNELQVTNDWNLILDKDRKRKKTKAKGSFYNTFILSTTTWGAK
jgi:hypothetical protein